jgi:putative adhesin
MKKSKGLVRSPRTRAKTARWTPAAVGVALIFLLAGVPAQAQGEKRTVFAPDDFHWQGSLKAGQTLEVINTNGEIGANRASGDAARIAGVPRGGDANLFVEVVEYAEGVTICAVYAKDKTPGRCHRGGVSSESGKWSLWHGDRAKINFDVQVPRGVRLHATTTNGGVHCVNLDSVVEATTTNGNVEVSTSEWASAKTTNGRVRVSMGNAKWSGELELLTTNGSVDVTLPASAEFQVHAATTNGGIQSDFPITVQGRFGPKSLSGTVGSGGRELKVTTTNGGIDLKKS